MSHALMLWLLVAPPEADINFAKEAREWAKVPSSDPVTHIHLSWIYVEVGLGEAARDEAQTAVALAPKNAEAHYRLGIALAHDIYGRFCHRGADLPGAIAELRKAKALDPKNGDIALELAAIYANDPKRLADAATEFRAARKELGDGEHNVEEATVLIRLGRYAEAMQVADAAKKLPPTQTARVALAAAAAATNPDELRRRAALLPEAIRKNTLQEAGRLLYELRLYDASILAVEESGTAEGAQLAGYVRQMHRYESLLDPPTTPVGVVQRKIIEAVQNESGLAYLRIIQVFRASKPDLLPEGILDTVWSFFRFEKDGDDQVGWRVRLMPVQGGIPTAFYGVGRELIATSDRPAALGLRAKAALDAGDEATAKRWLDWAIETSPSMNNDPLSMRPIALLWSSRSTRADMPVAIAGLLAEDEAHAAEAAPIVSQCSQPGCDLAQAIAYAHLHKYREVLAASERLARKVPDSERAFRMRANALVQLRAASQLRLLASQRLREHPDDKEATMMFGRTFLMNGDGKGYERELRRVIDAGKADSAIYNQIAWLALFLRPVNADDVALARKAVEGSHGRSRAQLNTLAAVLADAGKVVEARNVLVDSWMWMGVDGPQPSDFYVLGRIAEQVGRRSDAAAFYRKEPTPPAGTTAEFSAYLLAQRRLAALK